jgi:CheY-like chemotaxis protein/Tfp pilus assembly protein PilZ
MKGWVFLIMGDEEQRRFPRSEAAFRVRSSDLNLEGVGTDLSKGGMFVQTSRFFPLNAVLRLSVEPPEGPTFPVTCRVVFVRDVASSKQTGKPHGMGLELLDVPADKRALLDELLADSAPREPRPARVAGQLNVIVVDDDSRYRDLAAEPFRKRGDHVRTTADGLQALSMCLKDPPDVILSDVQMPRMDGWQLLRLVRARPSLSAVPVIFLTMLNSEAERLLGYQLGVDAYIGKPYNPDEMLVRVHQIVRRAQRAQSSPAMRTTMRGELEHVNPTSLLSFIEMEKKTGVLLLIGEDVARLFIKNGQIIRAEIEGVRMMGSRKVVQTILDWRSGQFEFAQKEVSGKDDVGSTITQILLEHARFVDEKAR